MGIAVPGPHCHDVLILPVEVKFFFQQTHPIIFQENKYERIRPAILCARSKRNSQNDASSLDGSGFICKRIERSRRRKDEKLQIFHPLALPGWT